MSDWIKYKGQELEPLKKYIVYTKQKRVSIYINATGFIWENVTHYMELPELPKEKTLKEKIEEEMQKLVVDGKIPYLAFILPTLRSLEDNNNTTIKNITKVIDDDTIALALVFTNEDGNPDCLIYKCKRW